MKKSQVLIMDVYSCHTAQPSPILDGYADFVFRAYIETTFPCQDWPVAYGAAQTESQSPNPTVSSVLDVFRGRGAFMGHGIANAPTKC